MSTFLAGRRRGSGGRLLAVLLGAAAACTAPGGSGQVECNSGRPPCSSDPDYGRVPTGKRHTALLERPFVGRDEGTERDV